MKRIVCMGGGPAGLYSAILFKKALPGADVEIFERNRPDDTFGWGVVFSDKTMGNFLEADAPSHARITDEFYHWDDIDVHFKGQTIRSGGHGFAGISRRTLLHILQKRAASLGVKQSFQRELDDTLQFGDADLVVIAEGANSKARARQAEKFGPDIEVRKCRYIWLGTTQKFSAFTFAFEKTEFGWFQIHAYQFSKDLSTVIVETREETWAAHGLDKAGIDESIAFCEKLFAAYIGNSPLLSNARHPPFSAVIETNLARGSGVGKPRPPMFLPFRLREMHLVNRVVVSPMAQYRAVDGVPGDWHLVHYGARATGGAGLMFTEMTCTSADARISPAGTGLWNETQPAAWQRIVEFRHTESQARFCLQL